MNDIENMQLSEEQLEALDTLRNYLKKAINSLTEFIKKYCDDNNMTIEEFHELIVSKELKV